MSIDYWLVVYLLLAFDYYWLAVIESLKQQSKLVNRIPNKQEFKRFYLNFFNLTHKDQQLAGTLNMSAQMNYKLLNSKALIEAKLYILHLTQVRII